MTNSYACPLERHRPAAMHCTSYLCVGVKDEHKVVLLALHLLAPKAVHLAGALCRRVLLEGGGGAPVRLAPPRVGGSTTRRINWCDGAPCHLQRLPPVAVGPTAWRCRRRRARPPPAAPLAACATCARPSHAAVPRRGPRRRAVGGARGEGRTEKQGEGRTEKQGEAGTYGGAAKGQVDLPARGVDAEHAMGLA